MEINKYTCNESDTIKCAMEKIDRNGRGVVFVCNERNELVAAASDGDIRRFILKGGNIEEPVSVLANYCCISLRNYERDLADEYMQTKGVNAIPIIDESRRIADICFRIQKPSVVQDKIHIPVVIMAGGKGTRLKPYTDILPKPLIPIGSKTIVERIMDQFKNAGCSQFSMIVNYMKHFIKAYFVDKSTEDNIEFIEETEFLGTGGGLSLLRGKYDDTFFLTNCDILIDADYKEILDYHRECQNIITLVCAEKKIVIPYGTIETDGSGVVIEMREKPSVTIKVNTGLYVIEPAFIEKIQDNQRIDITDVIAKCMEDGERVGTYLIDGEQWMDMGQISELEKMQQKFK